MNRMFLGRLFNYTLLALIAFISIESTAICAQNNGSKAKRKRPPTFQELCDEVQARSVLLVDATTGETLFARNPHTPYPPASILKLMTALLVYEKTKLEGQITVHPQDTQVEPSHIPLKAGEVVQVRDMANALLISSDNDSAMALARYTGGGVAEFVAMMNRRARELGCNSTVFKNPHGLPIKGQVTTAHDMLLIFKKVLEIPELRKIAQKKNFQLRTRIGLQTLVNHNKLLGKYPGLGPAKTGWTYSSRHTYAASATRGGHELLLIILNSPNKWEDTRILLDYGFSKVLITEDDAETEDTSASLAEEQNIPSSNTSTPSSHQPLNTSASTSLPPSSPQPSSNKNISAASESTHSEQIHSESVLLTKNSETETRTLSPPSSTSFDSFKDPTDHLSVLNFISEGLNELDLNDTGPSPTSSTQITSSTSSPPSSSSYSSTTSSSSPAPLLTSSSASPTFSESTASSSISENPSTILTQNSSISGRISIQNQNISNSLPERQITQSIQPTYSARLTHSAQPSNKFNSPSSVVSSSSASPSMLAPSTTARIAMGTPASPISLDISNRLNSNANPGSTSGMPFIKIALPVTATPTTAPNISSPHLYVKAALPSHQGLPIANSSHSSSNLLSSDVPLLNSSNDSITPSTPPITATQKSSQSQMNSFTEMQTSNSQPFDPSLNQTNSKPQKIVSPDELYLDPLE